jgi:outer membrane protein
MKKRRNISIFVVATVVLIFGQTSLAQDMQGRFGVGVRAAYVIYEGDEYDYLGNRIEADYDEAGMYGGNLTYFVHKYISFELSADYVETDVNLKIPVPGETREVVGVGEIQQIPLQLTARTHISTNPKINPYFGVGLGYYVNDFNSADLVRAAMPPGGKLEVDESIGFHINTGVEIFLDEHVAFNLELEYVWNDTDLKARVPGYTTEEMSVELDGFCAAVGVKFYF